MHVNERIAQRLEALANGEPVQLELRGASTDEADEEATAMREWAERIRQEEPATA